MSLSVVLTTSHAAELGAASGEAILEGVKATRRAIGEGTVTLQSRRLKIVSGELQLISQTDYACWFRESELRMDRIMKRVSADGELMELLREVTVLDSNGAYIHYETPPTGETIVANIYASDAGEAGRKSQRTRVWDVRLLGLCPDPFPILHAWDWSELFSSGKVTATEIDDDLTRVDLTFPQNESNWSIWVDVRKGNQPVRIECVTRESRGYALDVSLKNWNSPASQPQWFPETVTLTCTGPDGSVEDVNECVVKKVNFEAKLPTDTFALSGIGLVPGHVVQVVAASKRATKTWDGSKLGAYEPNASPVEVKSNVRALLMLNGVVFGILAILFLWMKRMWRA